MEVLRGWRQWVRQAFFVLYFVGLVVALPLCVQELYRNGAPAFVEAWFVGGVFVLLALPISAWGILQHMVYNTQPELQRHIIRILLMVPIYATNSWFALRFSEAAIYLDTVRECYEAYVIYNFMRYLLNYLHQQHPDLERTLSQRRRVKHFIPFCCLSPWPRGRLFLIRCRHGVLQYAVVRPTMTVISLICELTGSYDEGTFNFTSAWSYIVVVNNVSQVWAVYCLLLFYKGTKQELSPIKPVPKFLCVKAIIFMSFWQSVLIAALVNVKVIPQAVWVFEDMEAVAKGLQDVLICVEMFVFAVVFDLSFPPHPFMQGAQRSDDWRASCLTLCDVSDVCHDVTDFATHICHNIQDKLGCRKIVSDSNELSPLLTIHTTTTTTSTTTTTNNNITTIPSTSSAFHPSPDSNPTRKNLAVTKASSKYDSVVANSSELHRSDNGDWHTTEVTASGKEDGGGTISGVLRIIVDDCETSSATRTDATTAGGASKSSDCESTSEDGGEGDEGVVLQAHIDAKQMLA